MIAIGTALNIISALLAYILYAAGASIIVVMIVFFICLPWNFFLFLAVWRSANHAPPSAALFSRTLAALWLIAVILI